jgi:C4-dicarboxylate transporter DctQ subunit
VELLWPTLALLALVVVLFAAERRFPDFVDRLEENILASLLAIITIVSFTQVVARYGFNTGWSGALEFTRVMFAWMILFGMSYGIKNGLHLGVDAFVRLLPSSLFRLAALFAAFTPAGWRCSAPMSPPTGARPAPSATGPSCSTGAPASMI